MSSLSSRIWFSSSYLYFDHKNAELKYLDGMFTIGIFWARIFAINCTCITYIVCTAMPAVFIPTCELHCRCMSTKIRCKNSSLRARNFFSSQIPLWLDYLNFAEKTFHLDNLHNKKGASKRQPINTKKAYVLFYFWQFLTL